jgi:hypothetical protein
MQRSLTRAPSLSLLLSCGLLAGASACGDSEILPSPGSVRSVQVSVPTFLCGPLAAGDSIYADAGAYGEVFLKYTASQEPRRFRWTSTAPEVVSVSATGLLKAARPGTATITAETDGVIGLAEIQVTRVAATAEVTPARPGGAVGDTIDLTAFAYDGQGAAFRTSAWPWFWTGYVDAVHVNERTATGARLLALRPGTSPVNWCYAGRYGVVAVKVTR